MATAKRLPSGAYRVLVYSHTENTRQDDGTFKRVRRYESFTHEEKAEAEYLAAEFARNRDKSKKGRQDMTLSEAIDEYISRSDSRLSPTTIAGYKKIKRNHFLDIMNTKIKKLTSATIEDSLMSEYKRPSKKYKDSNKTISEKTVANAYGLLVSILNVYAPKLDLKGIKLAAPSRKIKDLLSAETIMSLVYSTSIELPVLLAMWLSFSMSEIRGLTKSKSVRDEFIIIRETVVDADNKQYRREKGKAMTRIRKHRMPSRIQELINNLPTDQDELVSLSGHAVYMRWKRLLENNELPHMTFHDLRHVNASVMALLRVPDKYAMERGGWKTDKVMKQVYQHTFSEERQAVDDAVDAYFERALKAAVQHETQHDK